LYFHFRRRRKIKGWVLIVPNSGERLLLGSATVADRPLAAVQLRAAKDSNAATAVVQPSLINGRV